MSTLKGRFAFKLLVVLGLTLLAARAQAAPIDYVLFNTNTLVDLGLFTIDPTLAAPVGISDVTMTALTFSTSVGALGPLTITLSDFSVAPSFRARFLDGQLASVAGLGSGSLPGGILFFLDFTPFLPADPSLINLNAVGTFAVNAGPSPMEVHNANGSLGLRPVPEPGSLLLLAVGAGLAALRRRSTLR
jgi:hypothetical protein